MESPDTTPYYAALAKDQKLKQLLENSEPFKLEHQQNICLRLCASIMAQQLSVKVARVIYARFLELFGGEEPTPQQISDLYFDTLRAIGLSNAKTNYIRNVASFATAHNLSDEHLYSMSNEEVITLLTQIKGVGRWTVEMLLMFSLGREDVFAIDDLGIRNAMIALYQLDTTDKKALTKELIAISDQWKPYRTYACRLLWQYKDVAPTS